MSNINFVPDDYIQSNESRRANLMCLILFSVVMAALGGSFVTIKIRQRACGAEESLVNAKMTRMEESIKKFEDLQTKRKEMMRTALTTAELLEPVPRSVLLASLTNSLPPGVSLMKLDLMQKEDRSEASPDAAPKTKYQAAQGEAGRGAAVQTSPEKTFRFSWISRGSPPAIFRWPPTSNIWAAPCCWRRRTGRVQGEESREHRVPPIQAHGDAEQGDPSDQGGYR